MGEQAELILDGSNCECCGCYICDEGPGYPQLCASCEQDAEFDDKKESDNQ